ncbi:hypothetical protein [Spirosoma agri]|uniref:Uncharacterized protein n=1 Tax=Spirosoma agri TaxID=1987381 RepID=A0A6M0IHM8_9BACT|nr:hypothetical protein [Spirosoma agri]NEU67780.1 hypothetical protein [Spirosoma agri]
MKEVFTWLWMVYITTGISFLYYILPARLPQYKPTFFSACSVALGALATMGAINVWASLSDLKDCNCLLNDGNSFILSKEIILLGCLVIGGISLAELLQKFVEKYK